MFFEKFLYGFFGLVVLSPCVYSIKPLGLANKQVVASVLIAEGYSKLPGDNIDFAGRADPLFAAESFGLDTQVLLGDRLRMVRQNIKHRNSTWAQIKLLDQPTFKAGKWRPKVCFMRSRNFYAQSSDWKANAVVVSLVASMFAKPSVEGLQLGRLSMGTRIKTKKEISHGWVEVVLASGVMGCMRAADIILDEVLEGWSPAVKRDQLVRAALRFDGSPYRWGCSSGFDATNPALTGVDCSGLVYLAYRTVGLHVPRDAHDQFLAASPIKFGRDLEPGDLIFVAKINTEKNIVKVHHVMIFAGADCVIEATGLGVSTINDLEDKKQACIRVISSLKNPYLKNPLKNFWHGQLNERGDLIFFGTFFGDKVTYNQLAKGLLK
jgi:hypothetical protein